MIVNHSSTFDQLCIAIYSGASVEFIKQLIQEEQAVASSQDDTFDLNANHPFYGFPPIVFAVLGNNINALRFLWEQDVNVAADILGHNLLEWALSHPTRAPSQEILDFLTLPTIVSAYEDNTTPLHVAALTGNLALVEEHLNNPSLEKFFSNSRGITALKWAILAKQKVVADRLSEYLLESEGASLNSIFKALAAEDQVYEFQEVLDQLYRNYLCALAYQVDVLFTQYTMLSDVQLSCMLSMDKITEHSQLTELQITLANIIAEKLTLLNSMIEYLIDALRYYSTITTKQPNDHKEYIFALRLLAYCLTKASTIYDKTFAKNNQIALALAKTINAVAGPNLMNTSFSNPPQMVFLHACAWEEKYMTRASRSCGEKIEYFLNHFAIRKHGMDVFALDVMPTATMVINNAPFSNVAATAAAAAVTTSDTALANQGTTLFSHERRASSFINITENIDQDDRYHHVSKH